MLVLTVVQLRRRGWSMNYEPVDAADVVLVAPLSLAGSATPGVEDASDVIGTLSDDVLFVALSAFASAVGAGSAAGA